MTFFDTKHQRAAWLIALLGVILVISLLPYASGLLGAPVLYVAVSRLHERLVRRLGSRPIASLIVIVVVIVGLVLPLVWLASLLVGQAQTAASAILKSSLLDRIGAWHVGTYAIGPQIKDAGSQVVSFLAGNVFALLGTATRIAINMLLSLFGLYYLLMIPAGAWRTTRPYLPFR